MTPKFTTPCYVRVDDIDKLEEVCEQLKKIGYFICCCASFKGNDYLHASYVDRNTPTSSGYEIHGSPSIDLEGAENATDVYCGTNTELFLALAGMREDIDKGQWFTDGEVVWQCPYDKFTGGVYLSPQCPQFEPDKIRRATAEEIIEYFNK